MQKESLRLHVGDFIFEVFQEQTGSCESVGAWRWHCKAANGEKVCTSGESFASRSNAERALTGFIAATRHQEYRQVIKALLAECRYHDGHAHYVTDDAVIRQAASLVA